MPYGEDRTTTPTSWIGTKGYVGGTKDDSGLVHLNAREYDPTLGRFISVDPIMDLTDPQQWNAYAYSNSNPTTFSDPSGRLLRIEGGGGGGGGGLAMAAATAAAVAAVRTATTRVLVAAGVNPIWARIITAIAVTASNVQVPQVGPPTSEDAHNSRFARHEDDDRGKIDIAPKRLAQVGDNRYLWSDGSVRDSSGNHIYHSEGFAPAGFEAADDAATPGKYFKYPGGMSGALYVPGRDDPIPLSSGDGNLHPRYKENLPPGTNPFNYHHLEAQAAGYMRLSGATEADLFITGDYICKECVARLPTMLPKGATLTVWYRTADGIQGRSFTGVGS